MKLDLLRHGQTTAGSGFYGATDVPLSELGWQQMQQAVKDQHWQQIVSSPLSRCLAFAEQLAEQMGAPLSVEPRLRELNFGDWEARTALHIMQADEQALGLFWQDPYAFTPPNAEPMHAFAARVDQAIDALAERFKDQSVLVVTHAGVMRYLLAKAQGLAPKQLLEVAVEHASLHSLKWPCS